jgi:hypothetical protein
MKKLEHNQSTFNEKECLDFLSNNFTLDKYSITPIKDFFLESTSSTFSDKRGVSFKANIPLVSAYRNFMVADILTSNLPGLNEKNALDIIRKWKKIHS